MIHDDFTVILQKDKNAYSVEQGRMTMLLNSLHF